MALSDDDSISPYTEFTSRDGSIADNEDVADHRDELPHCLKNNAEFAWEELPVADVSPWSPCSLSVNLTTSPQLLNFRRRIFGIITFPYYSQAIFAKTV